MDVGELQENFDLTRDVDGIREVIVIGMERKEGCPFFCKGCGVHEDAAIVSPMENKKVILDQVSVISKNLKNKSFRKGYHVLVYNYGNVTNKAELCTDNLNLLLDELNKLEIQPKYVSLNSRGVFITEKLLNSLKRKKMGFSIHFILGVETLSENGGRIYGKIGIRQELKKMFGVINKFNIKEKTHFGIDAGFVFLPEFYTNNRKDHSKIKKGFINDIKEFVDNYVGKRTPIRLNIHPFYAIKNLPYKSVINEFDLFMETMKEVRKIVAKKNKETPKSYKTTLYIGVKDDGYETPKWKKELNKWAHDIEKMNTSKL